MGVDVRRGYLSLHVHVNYTKHVGYIKINLISVMDFNPSAAVPYLGNKREIHIEILTRINLLPQKCLE